MTRLSFLWTMWNDSVKIHLMEQLNHLTKDPSIWQNQSLYSFMTRFRKLRNLQWMFHLMNWIGFKSPNLKKDGRRNNYDDERRILLIRLKLEGTNRLSWRQNWVLLKSRYLGQVLIKRKWWSLIELILVIKSVDCHETIRFEHSLKNTNKKVTDYTWNEKFWIHS